VGAIVPFAEPAPHGFSPPLLQQRFEPTPGSVKPPGVHSITLLSAACSTFLPLLFGRSPFFVLGSFARLVLFLLGSRARPRGTLDAIGIELVQTLRLSRGGLAGHKVATFREPMGALRALETEHFEILITRVRFPIGQPNGVALVRMARMKRPSIKVVFTVVAELVEYTEGLGEAVSAPIDIPALIATVAWVGSE